MFFDIHCWKLQLVFVGVGYENFIYAIFAMQKDDSKFIVVIHHNIWKEYYLLVSAQWKCCKWELCSCDVLTVALLWSNHSKEQLVLHESELKRENDALAIVWFQPKSHLRWWHSTHLHTDEYMVCCKHFLLMTSAASFQHVRVNC